MMQALKNTKCNMVYKDYKHGLYLLELFVLWLKISKCNCTYNQCANCISIYLSCTSMPIVSNNRLEKYLCYVVMIRGLRESQIRGCPDDRTITFGWTPGL